MKKLIPATALGCLPFAACLLAYTQTAPPPSKKDQKRTTMVRVAAGSFEVKLTPQTREDKASVIGRNLLDKEFQGDLSGTSKGEMLTAMTATKGSAGYVAIEQVSGTLHGRSGTFVLQHNGIMDRGAPQLVITVVPDSGTGQLSGITGKMAINIANGKHSYEFEYSLPEN